jgi:UDP-N-acetylglucosamine 3-dehydrogenase
MATPLKLAIVGCGSLAIDTVLPHLAQNDARELARVVALCDTSADRLAMARQLLPVSQPVADFTSLDKLLNTSDAEAVLILVPLALHADYAIRCMRAGRHVYVQKPLACDIASGQQVVDTVAQTGRKLVAAPGQQLWPVWQEMCRRIANGDLGPIYSAVGPLMGWGGYELKLSTDPTWCFTRGCGPLRDHGVYGVQTLTYLLGRVARVTALANIRSPQRMWRGKTIAVTEPDNTALLMQHVSGPISTMVESWSQGLHQCSTLRISGLDGTIEGDPRFVGFPGIMPSGFLLRPAHRDPESFQYDPSRHPALGHGHQHLHNPHVWLDIHHLIQCIALDLQPAATAGDALHTISIIEAALASAQAGRSASVCS